MQWSSVQANNAKKGTVQKINYRYDDILYK